MSLLCLLLLLLLMGDAAPMGENVAQLGCGGLEYSRLNKIGGI